MFVLLIVSFFYCRLERVDLHLTEPGPLGFMGLWQGVVYSLM